MQSVLIGILLAFFFDLAICGLLACLDLDWKPIMITAAAVIVVVVCACFYIKKQTSLKWAAGFEAQKATIEMSLKSNSLTGFERAYLVQQASEANKDLAERKYYASQWYGFDMADDVLALHPISLE